ncbi:B12-binding domain-containing radical SAM protein, partial [bacterium]|nr:B12-binding domain-containing radical SAM protein [bacterium]
MKWLLISFQGDLGSFGVRYLSASLRKSGIDTHILFIPRRSSRELHKNWVEQVIHFIDELQPDMIGVSLMCCHFKESCRLSQAIRNNFSIPIVWGGLHPTIQPEECMEWCDILCRGEAELQCLELAQALKEKRPYTGIDSFWFWTDGNIIRNPVSSRLDDIDEIPFPDYDYSHQSILHHDRIIPLTYEVSQAYPPYNRATHFVFSSRGCSFRCSYCCSPLIADLTDGKYLRRRRSEMVIRELEETIERFPELKCIMFCDDDFIAANQEWLQTFFRLYTEKIHLPFMCAGNPVHITEERMDILTKTGLVGLGVGIQSFSYEVRKTIFNRPITDTTMDKAIEIINRYADDIKAICYDFIVDFPGDTDEYKKENIRRLNRIKRNFTINIFPFTSYPGTALDNQVEENHPSKNSIYQLNNPYNP